MTTMLRRLHGPNPLTDPDDSTTAQMLTDGADSRAAGVTDPATDAAKGAMIVYECLNAPYTLGPQVFPPLRRGALAAAERLTTHHPAADRTFDCTLLEPTRVGSRTAVGSGTRPAGGGYMGDER